MRQLGLRLRALREAKHLSQEVVAKRARISREYLSRLEAGRYDPTLGVLQRLAKALDVKVRALVA